MNIAFVYEDNSSVKTLKDKMKKLYFKLIKKVEIKKIVNDSYKNTAINKIMFCIPTYKFNKINKGLVNNLNYLLKQNNIKNIVLSKDLYNKILFKNIVYSYNYNILNGRFLVKISSMEILEYVMNMSGSNIKKEEISIMVNENSNINMEIITNIATIAKRVNLITNNISKFKKLEKKLYEEKGIMLSIGNNRKKGLAKSKFIVNIDFPEELLNKYKIDKRAVLINLENTCKINIKSFSGIIINNINIKYNDNIDEEINFDNEFDENQLYEARIIAMDSIREIDNIKKKDNFKIINTIGNNGIIHQTEYDFTKKLHQNT